MSKVTYVAAAEFSAERVRLRGFAGSAIMTSVLSAGTGAAVSTMIAALSMLLAISVAGPRLDAVRSTQKSPLFAVPRGVVLMLSMLAGITFLVEGAILDWGGVHGFADIGPDASANRVAGNVEPTGDFPN